MTSRRVFCGYLLSSLFLRSRANAQTTDLEGFDPIWRDAEHALINFFGDVQYTSRGADMEIPSYSDVGTSVPIKITVDAEMSVHDYPEVIHLLAHGNPTPHILSAWMQPMCGKAEFSTRIRLEKSQKVTLAVKMKDGRHIRIDKDVEVSFGACAQIGTGDNDDIAAFLPETRTNITNQATTGTIIPIRALISHPMETGMRKSKIDDEWIDQRIIHNFECSFRDKTFFRVRLYPAVATNPYFKFFLKAEQSGKIDFLWQDSFLIDFRDSRNLAVS